MHQSPWLSLKILTLASKLLKQPSWQLVAWPVFYGKIFQHLCSTSGCCSKSQDPIQPLLSKLGENKINLPLFPNQFFLPPVRRWLSLRITASAKQEAAKPSPSLSIFHLPTTRTPPPMQNLAFWFQPPGKLSLSPCSCLNWLCLFKAAQEESQHPCQAVPSPHHIF